MFTNCVEDGTDTGYVCVGYVVTGSMTDVSDHTAPLDE
jgi:hypothetical protein